jgi:N-acetylglucosaminyldiphosphoundecaprenol N-acetyl-beta-D-mannosaminyltransferase
MLKKQTILGVHITDEQRENILKYILQELDRGRKKLFIVTPNPEIIVYAQSHLDYKDKLNAADVSLPDGVGLTYASQLMGKPLEERITGTDFIEELCKVARKKPLRMGFLGGRGKVAERTAECLKAKYPWIEVAYAADEANGLWQIADSKEQKEKTPLAISHKLSRQIDILFVAYGFPKQEEWIYDNLDKLPVKAAMGVGGAFDYISGSVPRAPRLLRSVGLEWLFRLIMQPWRLKRQLALITFLRLVLAHVVVKR